jgi:hypothetical protein
MISGKIGLQGPGKYAKDILVLKQKEMYQSTVINS